MVFAYYRTLALLLVDIQENVFNFPPCFSGHLDPMEEGEGDGFRKRSCLTSLRQATQQGRHDHRRFVPKRIVWFHLSLVSL